MDKATGDYSDIMFSENKPTGDSLIQFEIPKVSRQVDQSKALKRLIDKYSRKMDWK